jgi:hypothetical protein
MLFIGHARELTSAPGQRDFEAETERFSVPTQRAYRRLLDTTALMLPDQRARHAGFVTNVRLPPVFSNARHAQVSGNLLVSHPRILRRGCLPPAYRIITEPLLADELRLRQANALLRSANRARAAGGSVNATDTCISDRS